METNKKYLKVAITVVVLFFLATLFFFAAIFFKTKIDNSQKVLKDSERNKAYFSSTFDNNPKPLQDIFLSDIKNGVKDKDTKSDIYFITHRFFDNGGNIYEIYDYVNAHSELTFLKEAELIYPDIFKSIKERKLEPYGVDFATYAYLAYIETLYKHGYADMAALGTSANQYAKVAYFSAVTAYEIPEERAFKRRYFVKHDIKKSVEFIRLMKSDVNKIIDTKKIPEDIPPRDVLVGLNQYAASLRYLEALNVGESKIGPPKSSDEIFKFTTDYSRKNVPELHLFTSLLNASTLVVLSSSTPEEIRAALYPIIDSDVKSFDKAKLGILGKILDSRLEKTPVDPEGVNMGVYNKRNILILANKVPDFKKWLMINGWVESDFNGDGFFLKAKFYESSKK